MVPIFEAVTFLIRSTDVLLNTNLNELVFILMQIRHCNMKFKLQELSSSPAECAAVYLVHARRSLFYYCF